MQNKRVGERVGRWEKEERKIETVGKYGRAIGREHVNERERDRERKREEERARENGENESERKENERWRNCIRESDRWTERAR